MREEQDDLQGDCKEEQSRSQSRNMRPRGELASEKRKEYYRVLLARKAAKKQRQRSRGGDSRWKRDHEDKDKDKDSKDDQDYWKYWNSWGGSYQEGGGSGSAC